MAWGLGHECPLFSTNQGNGVYRSAFITVKVGTATNSELKLVWPVPGLGIKVTGLTFHGDQHGSCVSLVHSAYFGYVTSSYASTAASAGNITGIQSTASFVNPCSSNINSYHAPQQVTSFTAFEIAAGNYFAFSPADVSYTGAVVIEIQYADLG